MDIIRDYNPLDPDVLRDPYPYYTWMRQHHPVYDNDKFGFWALSRYEDVEAAARNHTAFSSAQGVGLEKRPGLSMLENDPPNHVRLRMLVSQAFTPHMMEQMKPRLQQLVDTLLDDIIAKGRTFDLMQDLAHPLPIWLLTDILGVEPEHRDDFYRWSNDVIYMVTDVQRNCELTDYEQSWEAYQAYMAKAIGMRRRPQGDLISALVCAEEGGERLTETEIFNTILIFLIAGNEITTNLLGNVALTLFSHPEQERKLRQNPSLTSAMIEEVLRYDSPTQLTFRTTTRDVEMQGVTIPRGHKVALIFASANRDSEIFANPDRFDIERPAARHLGFGTGIHSCLGAPLARLSAHIVTAGLMRRMRQVHLRTDTELERIHCILLRGLMRLPLAFEPA